MQSLHNRSIAGKKAIIKILAAMFVSLIVCFGNNAAYGARKKVQTLQQYNIKRYIRLVEIRNNIPRGLLAAIAQVESSYRPFAVNFAGESFISPNSSQAAGRIRKALNSGKTNIDIGVMQLNYRWHASAFNNVEEMLNPVKNIQYAAKLIKQLYHKHGNWQQAIAYYHSSIPNHNIKYKQKVMSCWLGIGKVKNS